MCRIVMRGILATAFGLGQTSGELQKAIEDVQWKLELSDIADVGKIRYTGPGRGKGPDSSMILEPRIGI